MRHWRRIRDECDEIWRAAIKARDKGRCQITGEFSETNPKHHIFGRGGWLLRLNVDYGVTLNDHWHTMFHGTAGFQHGTPAEQKHKAMEQLFARLSQSDERRAVKILKMWNGPRPITADPCWENVLKWVKDQAQAIGNDQWMNGDIEPQYGMA